MRLAITGTTGRVGRALADRLGRCHEVLELPRQALDLASGRVAEQLAARSFDALLNPAGLTGLEDCEDDPELAWRVNAEAPGECARVCAARGVPMLHFSTDYVFDGSVPGWRSEDEPPEPLSVYGKSKREGERRLLAAGGTVMRVSWVFGPEKAAFPERVLADALAGRDVAAVADKFSRPTFTGDLAGWVAAWLEVGAPGGVFHACNGGPATSWHGMAAEILAVLAERGLAVPALRPLELDRMTAFRAPRPRHSAMATPRLEALLGRTPRDWREALREHVQHQLAATRRP
jgi:dTDP-4-dehydrorhamnose reductase